MKNTLKSCKFYYLNIRGLKSKIESLKEIIIEEKPEVIGLVETMLDGKDKVVMEGYTIYRNDRSGDGGGVLIAIKDVLKGIMVEESNSKRKEESIWLSLTNNKTKIRIGLVYNPQENKTTKDELEEVYGRIESEIKKSRKMEQHIIVMGDMNCKICDLIDGNKEEISKGGKIMIKMIKENNMIILMSGGNTVDMVYLDFAKALFDKLDHGVLLQKIKTLGITGKLGVWLYHFLTHRTHFVRLQGGISHASPVLSGVPQGTVLCPLLFLILMGDINSGISSSSIVSFADDTRLYHGISNVDDCSFLQNDLNSVYDWASCNNMSFNAQKFQYICFSPHSSSSSNVYTSSSFDIINYSKNILDLGINVSSDCSFDFHISNLVKRTKHLTGWILRTFSSRES